MKTTGNTILITGGGGGIGGQMAQRWHDAGNVVIITGRNLERLQKTALGRANIHAMTLDVNDRADIARFAKQAIAAHPSINVLVNNAGIMTKEDITAAGDLSDAEAMITTNILGPIRMTDAFVDHLKAQDDSVLINVTSGLAFVPMPSAPTYSATKAALHSLSVAQRVAFNGQIEVIEIAPPAVQTELTPGQSTREGYLPLATFTDQVMAPFEAGNPPAEVCVPNALFLRNAELEGRLDAALEMVSQF